MSEVKRITVFTQCAFNLKPCLFFREFSLLYQFHMTCSPQAKDTYLLFG